MPSPRIELRSSRSCREPQRDILTTILWRRVFEKRNGGYGFLKSEKIDGKIGNLESTGLLEWLCDFVDPITAFKNSIASTLRLWKTFKGGKHAARICQTKRNAKICLSEGTLTALYWTQWLTKRNAENQILLSWLLSFPNLFRNSHISNTSRFFFNSEDFKVLISSRSWGN